MPDVSIAQLEEDWWVVGAPWLKLGACGELF